EIGINGGNHNASFNCNQIYTDQGNTDPCINDDSFVKYPIQNINETRTAGYTLNGHRLASFVESSFLLGPSRTGGLLASARDLRSRGRSRELGPPRCRSQGAQVRIELPPVQSNLFGFIDAAYQQANAYCQ